MTRDQICLVQFPHPGREWGPDRGSSLRSWTQPKEGHGRKYIRHSGRFSWDGITVQEGEIGFWGEWEAPSSVTPIEHHETGGPKWIHEPTTDVQGMPEKRQNTDPYVFGGFFYTGCKQEKRLRSGGWAPTAMQRLAAGSVILFGSTIADDFVVDTVFVVSDGRPHNQHDFQTVLRDQVPAAYWDVMLRPWYADDTGGRSYRLYRGATIANREAGIFSFIPCLPFPDAGRGFLRPRIDLKGIVNPGSRQANRLTVLDNIGAIIPLWRSVVEQVLKQGCALGVAIAEVPG
jgi:hypothetical protein